MAGFFITKAASGDLATCKHIMREIYGENPSYWPYGLYAGQMDHGLYLVRKSANQQPVGFVGWQEINGDDNRKIGYYSVGILPEYRKQGFARSAVSQLLQEKAAGVDEVRALIKSTNEPSQALARSLDVPIEKVAISPKLVKELAWGLIPGTANATAYDRMMNPDKGWADWDWGRALQVAKNFGIGLATPVIWGKGKAGPALALAELTAGTPVTNAAIAYAASADADIKAKKQMADAIRSSFGWAPWVLGGGLGLIGLSLLARRNKQNVNVAMPEQVDKGKVRVTLPTRSPTDAETQVELPFDADTIALSNSIQGHLGRDVRRRLIEEARTRTRRRGQPIINSALPLPLPE